MIHECSSSDLQMPMIKLRSSDEKIFDVDVEIAKRCETIKNMLDDLGVEDGDEQDSIPVRLSEVNALTLRKVLEWAEHHKDDALEADDNKNEKKSNDISQWDADFLAVENSILFDLILAANFLNVKGLFQTAAKTLALMLKDKTPDEIRAKFSIENDLTDAENEKIREEMEWCKEK